MDVKAYLMQYLDALRALDWKRREYRDILDRASSSGTGDSGVHSPGISDKTGRGGAELADAQNELQSRERDCEAAKARVEKVINAIEDYREQSVLRDIFIRGAKQEALAFRYNVHSSTIWRIYQHGLINAGQYLRMHSNEER